MSRASSCTREPPMPDNDDLWVEPRAPYLRYSSDRELAGQPEEPLDRKGDKIDAGSPKPTKGIGVGWARPHRYSKVGLGEHRSRAHLDVCVYVRHKAWQPGEEEPREPPQSSLQLCQKHNLPARRLLRGQLRSLLRGDPRLRRPTQDGAARPLREYKDPPHLLERRVF
jgi:hypothetical protein